MESLFINKLHLIYFNIFKYCFFLNTNEEFSLIFKIMNKTFPDPTSPSIHLFLLYNNLNKSTT